MGNGQVRCAHRDLQRIDLCVGWEVETRLGGRGGQTPTPASINAIAAIKLTLRI